MLGCPKMDLPGAVEVIPNFGGAGVVVGVVDSTVVCEPNIEVEGFAWGVCSVVSSASISSSFVDSAG
jgi:hypothetical protein